MEKVLENSYIIHLFLASYCIFTLTTHKFLMLTIYNIHIVFYIYSKRYNCHEMNIYYKPQFVSPYIVYAN